MRFRSRSVSLCAFGFGASLFFAAGCATHDDFPKPLDVKPVPTPTSFVITQPTPGQWDYDFTWEIDDPDGVVDRYRIYLVGTQFSPDELLGETQVTSFLATFPFSVSGVRFAVAAISDENVEGGRAQRTAP